MQLLTPIFTSFFSVLLGLERARLNRLYGWVRVLGLLAAVGGAAWMLLTGLSGNVDRGDLVTGTLCFVVNTLAASCFLLVQRPLVQEVPPTRVVFWAYLFGTIYLALSSLYYANDASVWHVGSTTALAALAYAVVINSCVVYLVIAWVRSTNSLI